MLETFGIWNSQFVNMPIPFPKDYGFQDSVTEKIAC